MALQQLAALGRVARSGGRLAQAIAGRPFSWREAQRAADAVGPGAAMPVVVIMAAIGSIAAIEGSSVLRHFGAPALLPAMLAQAIVRDFAPTMTALMLAAQVGTSFAGELGAMRV
ncbi:MAG: ABC transporter permease, partial [Cyanobacteria bacterium REEB65]|nr:ABC transporter permease [Cyanobacteria bacterium REEB65]